jgi:hypothetical protein
MRKFILVLSTLSLVSFSLFCQEIDLAWGPEKDFDRSNIELGYVGRVKDHFYTLRKEDKTMYLAKTRVKDMSLVFDREIVWNSGRVSSDDNNLRFKSFRLFKTHFVFYFTDYSSKDDIERIYAQKIDFEGKPFDPLVEIGNRPKERRSKDGSFGLSYSADSSNFLLVTNPSFDKYTNERFLFKILDSRLQVQHNLELTLPFKDKDFEVTSVSLSKSKIVYVLAKITLPKKERKDDEAPYYYEIVSIDPNDKGKVKEFEIVLDKRYVDEVELLLDSKDNVKCFGFYADMQGNGKRKDGINGLFYFGLSNGKVSNMSVKEFDAKLVEDIAGRKRANRDRGLRSSFTVKNFFEKPDGGAMILAEEAFVEVVTVTSSNGTSSTTYYYNYNSVLAVNIDPKGSIVWYAHVPKKQRIANEDRFGSFYGMYVKGKIYLIYNDEEENAATKTYDNVMRNYLKCVPVAVTISEDGKSDKKMMMGMERGKKAFTIKPNAADKISASQAFFHADRVSKACCVLGRRKTKTQRFGILTIK